MEKDCRPDPDQLLQRLQLEESVASSSRGHLKILLGAAAGVGKTYKMLEEAQQLKKNCVDVVVALVETHGRAETEVLLEGLEIIPRLPSRSGRPGDPGDGSGRNSCAPSGGCPGG